MSINFKSAEKYHGILVYISEYAESYYSTKALLS